MGRAPVLDDDMLTSGEMVKLHIDTIECQASDLGVVGMKLE